MSDVLHRRVQEIRARAAVRAWEIRQEAHANGVWYRLRRVLAAAREAWEISEHAARALEAAGVRPEPVGTELEPAKTILFVDGMALADIPERRRLAIHLDADLLGARHLALVAWGDDPKKDP